MEQFGIVCFRYDTKRNKTNRHRLNISSHQSFLSLSSAFLAVKIDLCPCQKIHFEKYATVNLGNEAIQLTKFIIFIFVHRFNSWILLIFLFIFFFERNITTMVKSLFFEMNTKSRSLTYALCMQKENISEYMLGLF